MVLLADRLYSEFHFWVKQERSSAFIGMSDYASAELGEVDYLELPEPGDLIVRNRSFGVAETSKALTELVAPVSGSVLASNPVVLDSPETLLHDPYGTGWLIRIALSDESELGELMTPEQYHHLMGCTPTDSTGPQSSL
jgi:glycine cleavage system H protein